jgi:hypothetical protein
MLGASAFALTEARARLGMNQLAQRPPVKPSETAVTLGVEDFKSVKEFYGVHACHQSGDRRAVR